MSNNFFDEILKKFLHDPIDKCFDIPGHEKRAREYAKILGISGVREIKGPDEIASCMERSLLPEGIIQELTEIRHPFSEGEIKIKYSDKNTLLINGIEINKNTIFDTVEKAFKNIYQEINFWDNKKKFLYLWRNLMEEICEKLKENPIKKYIPLLPADTRVPDHSIWEHLKITSAINAYIYYQNKESQLLQNNSLFLFTIGPVQSFIAQARKTQDLFMGSFLLSYLSFTAMEEIIENYGPTSIIYPDLFSQPLMDLYLEKYLKNEKIKKSYSAYIDQPTIPNRFVAIIPESEKSEIEKIAKDIIDKLKEKWGKIVTTVLEEFGLKNNETIQPHISSHTKDFPEIYWVSIPLKIDTRDIETNDLRDFFEDIKAWQELWYFAEKKGEYKPNIGLLYEPIYTSLEKSMGARKNLRDFEQIEEKGKKCHLCGEREGVIKTKIGNLKVGKYIGETENLCVLCFVKRGLDKYLEEKVSDKFKNFSFPSTAEVAITDFKEKALKNAKEEFKEYIKKFRELVGEEKFMEIEVSPLPKIKDKFDGIENLEGEWFFEENLTVDKFKELGLKVPEKEIEILRGYLQKIYEKVGEPNPYYAILKLDADNMGRWLSGELLPEIRYAYNSEVWEKLPDGFKNELEKILKKISENGKSRKILTPAIHASISTALRNYSIEFVRKIVEEEHYGKLIYAGGDDVLAFVNIKDLFKVMIKLRASFSGQIKFEGKNIKVEWNNTSGFVEKDDRLLLTMGKNATASCGVAIAHYKMPLKIVLDKVREMEEKAKEGEKDAFAIALLKHSGEERIRKSKWRYDNLDVIKALNKISQAFIEKQNQPYLSKGFIFKFNEAFARIKEKGENLGDFKLSQGIFDAELKRILKRSVSGGNKEEREKFIKEKAELMRNLFWKYGNIDNFINLLYIASFIEEKEDENVYKNNTS